MFLSGDRDYLSRRSISVLLAVSVLTNVLLLGKIYSARVIQSVVIATQSPPVAVASDHVRGNPGAPVTIIVYMDYQCPFCARLNASMVTLLKTVNARWIYRDFPLDAHPFAETAAETAECAGAQGKFWQYSDALFDPQNDVTGDSSFTVIGAKLGLDTRALTECVASQRFQRRVAAQQQDGVRRRITGTPTFFVNGRRFDGLIPLDQLKKEIESAGG